MDSGSVKSFSAQGTLLWTFQARGRLSPHVTRSPEGIIYIARTNGIFIALNRAGRELWRINLADPLSGPAVQGWDGRLFIPAGDRIYCLTASGHLLWQRNLGAGIALTPAPDHDGGVMMGLESGVLLRLGPFGEAQTLYLSAVPRAIVPMGPTGEGGRVLIVYPNGGMEGIDFRSADFNRGPQPLPRIEGRPLAAAGWGLRAAVMLEGGRLLGLNGLTGETRWSAEARFPRGTGRQGETEGPDLLYDERGVYALSRSGASGFDEEGGLIWRLDLQGTASVPSFGDDGILYSGGEDWILYAFRLEDRVRQVPTSLYGPEPGGTYGTGAPPPSSWTNNPMRWEEISLENQLGAIRRDIAGGRVGERELEYLAYLMETAGAGRDPETFRYRPMVHINHRVRALQLLALIGSRETIPFLTRIFREDRDPAVRAAAANAIGAIGADRDGIALRVFGDAVFSPSLRDEQVMAAVTRATGTLSRFSGPPFSEAGIRILVSLNAPNRPNMVRALAKQELESLGK
jgi:outer membrane protein assembly factor BamB